jgi:hypothetical protein
MPGFRPILRHRLFRTPGTSAHPRHGEGGCPRSALQVGALPEHDAGEAALGTLSAHETPRGAFPVDVLSDGIEGRPRGVLDPLEALELMVEVGGFDLRVTRGGSRCSPCAFLVSLLATSEPMFHGLLLRPRAIPCDSVHLALAKIHGREKSGNAMLADEKPTRSRVLRGAHRPHESHDRLPHGGRQDRP